MTDTPPEFGDADRPAGPGHVPPEPRPERPEPEELQAEELQAEENEAKEPEAEELSADELQPGEPQGEQLQPERSQPGEPQAEQPRAERSQPGEPQVDPGGGALFDAPEPAPGVREPSLHAGLEAILLVVDEPVPEVMLAQILERPRDEVAATLRELAAEYTEQGRGFDLREIAGGWRFYTRDVCAPLVERFVRDGQQARLTQAALETLAVIAYRQPVNRARVSAIRGVNSDGVIRTLTARGLIEEAGHDPEHQAVLYRTTTYFLERLGLNSVEELPELAPYLPDDLEGIEELQQ